jgi:hypothetical protein
MLGCHEGDTFLLSCELRDTMHRGTEKDARIDIQDAVDAEPYRKWRMQLTNGSLNLEARRRRTLVRRLDATRETRLLRSPRYVPDLACTFFVKMQRFMLPFEE